MAEHLEPIRTNASVNPMGKAYLELIKPSLLILSAVVFFSPPHIISIGSPLFGCWREIRLCLLLPSCFLGQTFLGMLSFDGIVLTWLLYLEIKAHFPIFMLHFLKYTLQFLK